MSDTNTWESLKEDWGSDKDAFKEVPWGKAMMWIFLLSDTFIFSCFLVGYMTVRMSTTVPWPPTSDRARNSKARTPPTSISGGIFRPTSNS